MHRERWKVCLWTVYAIIALGAFLSSPVAFRVFYDETGAYAGRSFGTSWDFDPPTGWSAETFSLESTFGVPAVEPVSWSLIFLPILLMPPLVWGLFASSRWFNREWIANRKAAGKRWMLRF